MNILKMKITHLFVALSVLFLGVVSCDDKDKHYDPDTSVISEYTLMDLINQNDDLSVFASMIEAIGYDSVLNSSQSYTVWAPVNDALADVDITDLDQVEEIVNNHIARFVKSASGAVNERVFMNNTKLLTFKGGSGVYYLEDAQLVSLNTVGKNGVLHTINSRVPFFQNIWEYLNTPGLDSIRDYLYSFNKKEFDPSASDEIDINEEGFTVYDSVFIESNEMWYAYFSSTRGIGWINSEDSIYTMIIPSNQAWIEAYDRIFPYFVNNMAQGKDSIQNLNTKYAIVKDLVFRGEVNPNLYGEADSLSSTRFGLFYDPQYLFENAEKIDASNGMIYLQNESLKNKSWESWNPTIKMEAEFSAANRQILNPTQVNTGVTGINYYNDAPEISNGGTFYVEAAANNTNLAPEVTFEIPNTLAGAYDIYCVFAPDILAKPAAPKMGKVRFEIQQKTRRGTDNWLPIASGGGMGGEIIPANNVIDTIQMTKMLVYENFKLPYANYNESENTIRLKVISKLSQGDTNKGFGNRMNIDCIIFEPVH
ncbi:fasciclin domain-containing protein [Bacteroidales bacterium OttesenSCG-928-M11]|nr:fasciclin domain-containing protein [Bacteroidales bacterium OttesenSCG-928-M11]